ncbi:hypothetical protein RvY_14420 [Ramazzottius varieornatus]|uniref:Uncharacterized protein n=1 Tax=Ramazzottius varieornatus TaxID=947166 RepID=A0A1D1VR87_RAMVA|nr:hypothetical protein RvY_14420 [Ramazzottius varieornatus]
MKKTNGALYRDAALGMVTGQRTRDTVFSIGGNEDLDTVTLASQADTKKVDATDDIGGGNHDSTGFSGEGHEVD